MGQWSDADGIHPWSALRGHTTGVEEESNEVTAMPLIQRGSNGGRNEERSSQDSRFVFGMREKPNGYKRYNLQIDL